MLQYRFSPLLALVVCLLSFGILAYGAPALIAKSAGSDLVTRGGTCSTGCTTGNQVVDILGKLKDDIALKLDLLDGCYKNGTDPAGIITDIVGLINVAVALILALPKDLLGLLNGKILVIVNLCVSIVIDIATRCSKWADKPNFDAFLTLCVTLDVALCGLLETVGGLLGTILGLIAGLLRGVLPDLLKLNLNSSIGILGL